MAMTITGWRFEGEYPDVPKSVIIVAPHTSNWDFPIGCMAYFAIGFRISFLAKHTVFGWPWGVFMRWLGGIPVERSVSKDRVAESIAAFNNADKMILVIAPEGTRKLVPRWKTGFYHVAHGARVPIVPIYFDFATKVIGVCRPFYTTGDVARDLSEIEKNFHGRTGQNPEQFQPVALPP
jgi:1-acyl-sn-glycerol-3-phosphate acyltransferase